MGVEFLLIVGAVAAFLYRYQATTPKDNAELLAVDIATPAIAVAPLMLLDANSEIGGVDTKAYASLVRESARKYGVPDYILARLLWQESRFNPAAIGPITSAGERAQGIAQFLPSTAAERGIDPFSPVSAIPGAAAYLAELYGKFGTWRAALAAYNWGEGRVKDQGLGKAPAETREYVHSILGEHL